MTVCPVRLARVRIHRSAAYFKAIFCNRSIAGKRKCAARNHWHSNRPVEILAMVANAINGQKVKVAFRVEGHSSEHSGCLHTDVANLTVTVLSVAIRDARTSVGKTACFGAASIDECQISDVILPISFAASIPRVKWQGVIADARGKVSIVVVTIRELPVCPELPPWPKVRQPWQRGSINVRCGRAVHLTIIFKSMEEVVPCELEVEDHLQAPAHARR